MKLTAQDIARYQPPQGKPDHIVFDEELSGFGLRYRGGRRTWVFQYAFGTGPSRVNARMTLGDYPASARKGPLRGGRPLRQGSPRPASSGRQESQ